MANANTPWPWSDEQWNRVQRVVYEEARTARVAGNLLPLYGPLGPAVSYVSKEVLIDPSRKNDRGGGGSGFTVEDADTIRLATLQTKIYLRDDQVASPELSSALMAFRRAANVLARLEDSIIFNGQAGTDRGPKPPAGEKASRPMLGEVLGGQESDGLYEAAKKAATRAPELDQTSSIRSARHAPSGSGALGEALVSFISGAVGDLEARYHLGPFACVLDQAYFNAAQTPNASSLVLPQDRILPLLGGGPLVRSSTLGERTGLVVALGGAPIDLVVGTDIAAQFLQVTEGPFFVFRVYEKIVLRIKEASAIQAIPSHIKGD